MGEMGAGMAPDLSSLSLYFADLIFNRVWDPKVAEEQRQEVVQFLGGGNVPLDLENPPVVGVVEAVGPNSGSRLLRFLTNVSPSWLNIEGLLEHFGFAGIDHDIVQIGRIVPCAKTIQGGRSIGHFSGTTGSIGCLVRDRLQSNATYLLGCNHVIAALNEGKRGADDIWVPGKNDGGGKGSAIGKLARFRDIVMVPKMFAENATPNLMDAALCEISPGVTNFSPQLPTIGKLRGSNSKAVLEMELRKEGWKTGLTTGSAQMKGSILVHYRPDAVARFDEQIAIYPTEQGKQVARQGDSGSVVVDKENRVVGLLFAMAEGMNIGYANPIQPILDEFGVEIIV
jgi:hypothetical protein